MPLDWRGCHCRGDPAIELPSCARARIISAGVWVSGWEDGRSRRSLIGPQTSYRKNRAPFQGKEAAPAIVEEYGEPWHKKPIAKVVADEGYHKASVLLARQQRS